MCSISDCFIHVIYLYAFRGISSSTNNFGSRNTLLLELFAKLLRVFGMRASRLHKNPSKQENGAGVPSGRSSFESGSLFC